MNILVVDGTPEHKRNILEVLGSAGYDSLFSAGTIEEAFNMLGIDIERPVPVPDAEKTSPDAGMMDLIIMADKLPDIDGGAACRIIKNHRQMQDIPIIIVTSDYSTDDLQTLINAGALYYSEKPLNTIEFLVHVQSALKIKLETDKRKQREEELLQVTKQLEEANRNLQKLSFLDGLTSIANRRRFDEVLLNEWQRAIRENLPISLIILDIDNFKKYNDSYGHLMGDECLKQVAGSFSTRLRRPADLVARFGGEEFAVILPNTSRKGAIAIAEMLRSGVEDLQIPHISSPTSNYVTVSAGVSSTIPARYSHPDKLVLNADEALYQAKHSGRNKVMY